MGEQQIHLANGDLLIKTDEGIYFTQPEGISVPILIDQKEGERLLFETAEQLRGVVESTTPLIMQYEQALADIASYHRDTEIYSAITRIAKQALEPQSE